MERRICDLERANQSPTTGSSVEPNGMKFFRQQKLA